MDYVYDGLYPVHSSFSKSGTYYYKTRFNHSEIYITFCDSLHQVLASD